MNTFVTFGSRRGLRRAAALAAAALILTTGQAIATGPAPAESVDVSVVANGRYLSPAEITAADITDSSAGRSALSAERSAKHGLDVDRRPHRVFRFGSQRLIVEATSRLRVLRGLNEDGETVVEVDPLAAPPAVVTRSGYVVPPTSAWRYNVDGGGSETVGTWKRTWFWTITHANDYKACATCTAYDYWRIYGRMQAATLTGSSATEGFKRAWLEFDRNDNGWTTPSAFELAEPSDSYGGNGTSTVTIGFKSGLTFTLGVPPVSAGGSSDVTYQGSITRNTENWHPVVRSEVSSGGVQWCRYEGAEFTGSRSITTMVSARLASNGSAAGGWYIRRGMQDRTVDCPSQV